jgi:hypothetical protein
MKRLFPLALLTSLACASDPGAGDGGPAGPGALPGDPRPVLDSVSAQVSGRQGRDLLVSLRGRDRDGDVLYAHLSFLSASGAPVAAADLDRDGVLDTEGLTTFDAPVHGQTDLTATVTLENAIFMAPEVATVIVALEDATGQRSSELTAAVLPQPTIPFGGSCDATGALNRCQSPFSCRGAPATCQEAVAPTLTKVAYQRHEAGPRILVAGEDPDDDVQRLVLEFLSAQGAPITVDLDNDGSPEASSLDIAIPTASAGGAFFAAVFPAPGFEEQVPRVAVTVLDVGNRESNRLAASLSNIPQKGAGQACDPRGFDRCREGFSCLLNAAGTATTCQAVGAAITAACDAAPVLDPVAGPTSTFVTAAGEGLWDPPEGCAAQDPTGRPDAVVKLRLATSVPALTVTTRRPGTTFDTIVYVLPACTSTPLAPLGCNDDDRPATSSTLRLENLAAGEYAIVIDAWSAEGGTAEVAVSLE